MINLILAVINQSFEKFQEEMIENRLKSEAKEKEAIESSHQTPIELNSFEEKSKQNTFNFKENLVFPKTKKCDFLNKIREKLKILFDSQLYLAFVTIVIILNTVFLAMDHYPMSDEFFLLLNYSNLAFTVFFFVEMILKLIAFKISVYLKDSMNIFDMFIVLTSIIEIILDYSFKNDSENLGSIPTLSALRALRLFRMFKILKFWVKLKILIQALIESLITLKYFSILLFIFMIISTFLGNELFAYKVRFINDTEIAGKNNSLIEKKKYF